MHWTDERYVRVYTRDTVNWKLCDWRARTVLLHMLRKVDRSGVIDVEGSGLEGVAAMLDLPLDIVEAGMEQLIRRQTVVANELGYTLPNFIDAQEAEQSDKLRARLYRERRRDKAAGRVTPRDGVVTNRDADVHSRDESSPQPSQPSEPAGPSRAGSQKGEKSSLSVAPPMSAGGWEPPPGGRTEKAAKRRIAGGEITAEDARLCVEAFVRDGHHLRRDPDGRCADWIAKQKPAKAASKRSRSNGKRVEPSADADYTGVPWES